MGTATKLATVGDILRQRCPRCRVGSIFRYSIFRGFPRMHERCSVCRSQVRSRSQGTSSAPCTSSYGLGLVIVAIIAAVLWSVTGWWITKDTIWAVVLFLPLAPTITLLARVLWIYLDQTVDPRAAVVSQIRYAFSSGVFDFGAVTTAASSFPCIAALNPRMPSPIPFPSSGSFFRTKDQSERFRR